MAQLNYNVNPDEQEDSFDVIPAGDYPAIIESSDYTPNKSGTGMILKLTYQIIDGPLKGRKLFENLNREHQNQQAVEISRKALNSIGVATGVKEIKDSSQLHNIPMIIDVRIKESAEYGKQNQIRKHTAISGLQEPATPVQQQTTLGQAENPAEQSQPANGAQYPWAQK